MFESEIIKLAEQSKLAVKSRSNERATENYVIQPFIKALGYDTSNPEEVEPEFSADVGTKKGEKVDYALKINNELVIILEIKAVSESLNSQHHSQLFRYFTSTDVRIAILTNGREAWFYSDLNKANVMDDLPFFKFDFQNNTLEERNFLEHFHRDKFNVNEIIEIAQTLENSQKIKNYMKNNIMNPNSEFIKFIWKEINGGVLTENLENSFKSVIKDCFSEIMNKGNDSKDNFHAPIQKEKTETIISSQKTTNSYDKPHISQNEFHLNYWQDFMEYLEKCGTSLRIPKATNRGFQTFPIRGGAFTLYGMIKTGLRQITVELYVKSEREFEMLKQNKESIDSNFAHELQWIPLPERKNTSAKIILINNSSPKEISQREEQFAWLKENLEKFNDVFGSTRY